MPNISEQVTSRLSRDYPENLEITAMIKHGSGVIVLFTRTYTMSILPRPVQEARVAFFAVEANVATKMWDYVA